METQIIWYNSAESKYHCGTLEQYQQAASKSDDVIIAEQFLDMPMNFVEKITRSLNSNLKELISV